MFGVFKIRLARGGLFTRAAGEGAAADFCSNVLVRSAVVAVAVAGSCDGRLARVTVVGLVIAGLCAKVLVRAAGAAGEGVGFCANVRVRAAETGIGIADAAVLPAFVSERFVSGPRALKGACACVFAALGLGVSRLADADRGAVRPPRSTPGRDGVNAPATGGRHDDCGTEGRCKAADRGFGVSVIAADFSGNFAGALEVLPEAGTGRVTLVDAGAGAGGGSENQSESSSSVLGAAGGAGA